MMLEFHPAVQSDFSQALAYYEAEGGVHLADRFEAEFRACIAAIKAGPTRFPYYHTNNCFRRVRLKSFPFLILYRDEGISVTVIVLKHERRHPTFGMARL